MVELIIYTEIGRLIGFLIAFMLIHLGCKFWFK